MGDFVAGGFDNSAAFVSDHLRECHAMVHVAVEKMEVGAANAAMGNAELNLACMRIFGSAVPEGYAPATVVECGVHG
jgi:hypothetical protein